MAFCPYCGTQVEGKFCTACGQPQPQPVEEIAPPVGEVVPPVEEIVAPVEEIVPPVEEIVPPVAGSVPPVEEVVAPAYEEPVAPAYEGPSYTAPAYTAPAGYDPQTGAPLYAQAPPAPAAAAPKKNPFAVLALIFSILSLVFCWLGWIDLVFLLPAIAFIVVAWIKKSKKGMTIAATVIGGVALIPTILIAVLVGGALAAVMGMEGATSYTDYYNDYDYSYDYDDYDYDYYDDYDYDYDYDYSYSSVDLSDLYYTYCDSDYAVYDYAENYLYIDTNPLDVEDYYEADAWEAIQDVNEALGLPYSLNSDMSSTTALDGEQYEFYDNVSIMWTYHPDEGLQVIYMEE